MNKTLQARLRAREKQVPAGGHTFTIRRPKAAEMLQDMTRLDLVRRFVTGWDFKGADLAPGGDPLPEPFDPELWADVVEDRPDLWQPLSDAILTEWRAFNAAVEATAKN